MRERALILIVDDNEDNMDLVEQILEDDYDTITAESGEQCLDIAAAKLPDLILLDVQMPGIDGYETLDRLLQIDLVKQIPVIFISARYRDQDRVIRGLESGALDYLTKPIDDELLQTKVRVGLRIKRAEDEVREKHQALLLSNQTLESFSYSASHDLRAPLRHICNYCEALQEDYAAELPDDAQFMLSRISSAATHMGDLIQDLLDFSRASSTELQFHRVDLSAIVQKVVDSLREADPHHTVSIEIEANMQAQAADKAMLAVVLNNLIGNAWKYSYKVAHPTITIASEMQDKHRCFYVKDNGAGFDIKLADKLFKPFSRLHNEDEFEGNGIGLATVERIISHHGGRIWVNAAVDQGACFYFTTHGGIEHE
ncbi:MAG: response regulator [Mariprofundus sp.]|nr:response regulator [Mariprofundus sp.]